MAEFETELCDYFSNISVSGFADMLHDYDRNEKYEQAIKKAIKHKKDSGLPANVLDIGTGTGLLSMMAVRHGANKVIACESFEPMSKCAQETIQINGFSDRIHLIPKRSTSLRVCPDGNGDMLERCNILITEIFDTELIGEGAIEIFRYANKHLLESDYIVVPNRAEIVIQVVESNFLTNWHRLNPVTFNSFGIQLPKTFCKCPGTVPVHDLQLSQLEPENFQALTEPTVILEFDFKTLLKIYETKVIKLTAKRSGKVQNVFMWWQLRMDFEDQIILSCAPNSSIWRDHWMQLIYYIPNPITVTENDHFPIHFGHNEYMFWFDTCSIALPECDCGLHAISTRSRIGKMNDQTILKSFSNAIKKLSDIKTCLFISDFSMIPFLLGNNVTVQYISSGTLLDKKLMNNIASINGTRLDCDTYSDFDLILMEPYFSSSFLPWDDFAFIQKIRKFVNSRTKIIPEKATIWAVAVQFLDLFKIVYPVKNCSGFKMNPFDKMIQESRTAMHDHILDAQALWEYPCYCLGDPVSLLTLDFKEIQNDITEHNFIKIKSEKQINGIALWVDWYLDNENTITTGPVKPLETDKIIKWYKNAKQGVHFVINNNTNEIIVDVTFEVNAAKTLFKFNYQ